MRLAVQEGRVRKPGTVRKREGDGRVGRSQLLIRGYRSVFYAATTIARAWLRRAGGRVAEVDSRVCAANQMMGVRHHFFSLD